MGWAELSGRVSSIVSRFRDERVLTAQTDYHTGPWKKEAAPEPIPEPVPEPTVTPQCGMGGAIRPCKSLSDLSCSLLTSGLTLRHEQAPGRRTSKVEETRKVSRQPPRTVSDSGSSFAARI